ncbi:MAG: AI-2E family transporter [Deltaproteobacteria bacterium]|nr:AI-2E family transporter [Deltaproteobacteria bacterium]
MKATLQSVMVVALTLSGLMLLYALLPLLVTCLVALALASTAETIVRGWTRRGVGRGLAVLMTYVLGIAVVALLAVAIVPTLSAELSALAKNAVPLYADFVNDWHARGGLLALIATALPGKLVVEQALAFHWQDVFKSLLLFGESTASAVVVLVLAVYWSIHRAHLTAAVHGLWPAQHRAIVRRTLGQVEVALGFHVVVEAVASLITLTMVFSVAAAQGLHYPVLLSVAVALLRLIPFLGPPLCIVCGIVAGQGANSTAAIVSPLAILAIERLSNALANNMLGHRKHNAFLVLILCVAAVRLEGWVGLLMAPALASVVEVMAALWRTPKHNLLEGETLSQRLEALEAAVEREGGARARKLAPLVSRLSSLISLQRD